MKGPLAGTATGGRVTTTVRLNRHGEAAGMPALPAIRRTIGVTRLHRQRRPGLTEKELLARDARRDLDAELLGVIEDLEADRIGRVSVVHDGQVIDSPVTRARLATRLSQARFADLLGISKRTLQD